MSVCIDSTIGSSGQLAWLDRLSRAAATWVMAVILFTVASLSLSPPISRATLPVAGKAASQSPSAIEKPWPWALPTQNFDGMYRKLVD